jgi:hypothetical protein
MDEQTQQTPTGPPQDDLQSWLQDRPNGGRSKSTMLLAAIVLVAVGFIGGLFVGKSMGNDSQQAAFPGGLGQNGPGFATGANGNGGGLPGGGNVTIGTIKSIDGDTITLQTVNGDTVTVNIGSDTTIQVTKDGSVGDLGTGDTLVVAGTQKSGSIDANSITEGGLGIPVGVGQGGGSS